MKIAVDWFIAFEISPSVQCTVCQGLIQQGVITDSSDHSGSFSNLLDWVVLGVTHPHILQRCEVFNDRLWFGWNPLNKVMNNCLTLFIWQMILSTALVNFFIFRKLRNSAVRALIISITAVAEMSFLPLVPSLALLVSSCPWWTLKKWWVL